MNKKTAGRISAMAMASMMMMSVCVVNASAEENEPMSCEGQGDKRQSNYGAPPVRYLKPGNQSKK